MGLDEMLFITSVGRSVFSYFGSQPDRTHKYIKQKELHYHRRSFREEYLICCRSLKWNAISELFLIFMGNKSNQSNAS